MVRLFVCIWIPEFLRDPIVKFQKNIEKLPLRAKFVEPENLHLTVTFLGDINEDINQLKKNLDASVKNINNFHVKLQKLKLIPNENYIRVIGIKAENEGKISNLIREVVNNVGGKFYEKTKLTLCRVKKIEDKRLLQKFIADHRGIKIGTFNVESVALVKSVLTKRGPIYETIHKSFLKQS